MHIMCRDKRTFIVASSYVEAAAKPQEGEKLPGSEMANSIMYLEFVEGKSDERESSWRPLIGQGLDL